VKYVKDICYAIIVDPICDVKTSIHNFLVSDIVHSFHSYLINLKYKSLFDFTVHLVD
jgi:hypothetical protein